MWRIPPSKYKNTFLVFPKKEESIYGFSSLTLTTTNHNNLVASTSCISFPLDNSGRLALLPLSSTGRADESTVCKLFAHSSPINDLAFSHFGAELLFTCSSADGIKGWNCCELGDAPKPAVTMPGGYFHLAPHSASKDLLLGCTVDSANVIDVTSGQTITSAKVDDRALSCCWSPDGRNLAVLHDRGKRVDYFDPQCSAESVLRFNANDAAGREGRILSFSGGILTSGFDLHRNQQIKLFDLRNTEAPLHVASFEASTAVLMPLYDEDTGLLSFGAKGSRKIYLYEDRNSLALNLITKIDLPQQTIGICMGKKMNMNLMKAEVQKIFQLTKSSIHPISCIVPRRSYSIFHSDLFPDTKGACSAYSAEDWLNGQYHQPILIKVRPMEEQITASDDSKTAAPICFQKQDIVSDALISEKKCDEQKEMEETEDVTQKSDSTEDALCYDSNEAINFKDEQGLVHSNKVEDHKPEGPIEHEYEFVVAEECQEIDSMDKLDPVGKSETLISNESLNAHSEYLNEKENVEEVEPRFRNASKSVFGETSSSVRLSLGQALSHFRHMMVKAGSKPGTGLITNLKNIATNSPAESKCIALSTRYAAVPLSGPAGLVAIVDLSVFGRLPDGLTEAICNGEKLMDFEFSPFNPSHLLCCCITGAVNLWNIDAREETLRCLKPAMSFTPFPKKAVLVKYNPVAENIVAIAYENEVIVISIINESDVKFTLIASLSNSDNAITLAWSAAGHDIAILCKQNHTIKIFDAHLGIIKVQKSLDCNVRAARLLFACKDAAVVCSYVHGSNRAVALYDTSSLSLKASQNLENGIHVFVPHFDFDTSVLFLSAKGDRVVMMYEIQTYPPYFMPIIPFTCQTGHQAIAFLNKTVCNVMNQEVQHAWRLVQSSIERLVFYVPRAQKNVFCSELYPLALCTWEPSVTASEWQNGSNSVKFVSLRPT